MPTFEELKSLITAVLPVIDRAEAIDRGLKILHISGDMSENLTQDVLCLLRNSLPTDVSIVDYNINSPLQFFSDNGTFRDHYSIILASRTWQKLNKPGDKIPEIEAIFSYKVNSRYHASPICEIRDVDLPDDNQLEKLQHNLKFQGEFSQELVRIRVNKQDYRDTLSVLLDTILDPSATSSNVIAVARELKKQLDSEHIGIPDAED